VPNYTLVFARPARKELRPLDRTVAARVLKRIETLRLEPPPSACRKLEGTDNLWRIRIGDWRVVESFTPSTMLGRW